MKVKTVPIAAVGLPVFRFILEVPTLIALISFKPVGVLFTIMPTVKLFTSDKVTLFETIVEVEVLEIEEQVLVVDTAIGPRASPVGVKVDADEGNTDQVPVANV